MSDYARRDEATAWDPGHPRRAKWDVTDLDWMADKACGPEHSALFFRPDQPSRGYVDPATSWSPKPALAICAGCPVVDECRSYAIQSGDIVRGESIHGVIGGVAPRAKYQRKR